MSVEVYVDIIIKTIIVNIIFNYDVDVDLHTHLSYYGRWQYEIFIWQSHFNIFKKDLKLFLFLNEGG